MGANDLIAGDDDWIHGEFFAPASTDLVDGLIAQYQSVRRRVEEIAALVTGETAGAVSYFLDGNGRDGGRYGMPSVERLFALDGALAALNASYWARAINMTDVLDAMPQKRRDEWNASIREHKTPDFEEETVRATLQDLLMSRSKFFAERVDGIFRVLSGSHVTNKPQGFGKRMILAGITNQFFGSTERVGYINDLRCVIAKFMGRDDPDWNATGEVVRIALRNRRGEWVSLDGGALRIRCYANGNAHLEVHPDMAWRLNCVLAQIYPTAIPSEFRKKPKKKPREFEMIQRPLPFAVLHELSNMDEAVEFIDPPNAYQRRSRRIPMTRRLKGYGNSDKHARNEAERVLASLGGVLTKEGYWQFDYDPGDVLSEIVCSGCVPDQNSHQFYPTPDRIARIAVNLSEIGPTHECLEPSAGTGGLADLMPIDQTLCVEISALHCKVLEAKLHRTVKADFLKMETENRFDRIVMNPPFSDGRWQAHLEHAASLLKPGGRLVAILPASARNRDVLPGMNRAWHGPYNNAFVGTGASVSILVAEAA